MSYRISSRGSVLDTTSQSPVPASDYAPSCSLDASNGVPRKLTAKKSQWFSQVKDWLSTSEPSAQAMKDQKKMTYKKHGIDIKDPQAAAKLHLPIGKLPEGIITSTSGPSPEKALKKAQQQRQERQSYSGNSQSSQSLSSSIFSVPSTKEFNPVAPWES